METTHVLRLSIFIGAFIIFALLEAVFAYNQRVQSKPIRWISNIGMSLISMVLLRGLGVAGLVIFSDFIFKNNSGLLSTLPLWLSISLTIILFDLAIYVQHVVTHKVPFLWRLHKVHHADRDLDVSSGIRFHPLEIVLSYLYKLCIIFILGPPAMAVVIFEIILNASAMFNHANFSVPPKIEKFISKIFVTPTMHRVHHSVEFKESNSNYGFFLSCWDKIFNTYIAKDNRKITLGLIEHQDSSPSKLTWNLLLPFKK